MGAHQDRIQAILSDNNLKFLGIDGDGDPYFMMGGRRLYPACFDHSSTEGSRLRRILKDIGTYSENSGQRGSTHQPPDKQSETNQVTALKGTIEVLHQTSAGFESDLKSERAWNKELHNLLDGARADHKESEIVADTRLKLNTALKKDKTRLRELADRTLDQVHSLKRDILELKEEQKKVTKEASLTIYKRDTETRELEKLAESITNLKSTALNRADEITHLKRQLSKPCSSCIDELEKFANRWGFVHLILVADHTLIALKFNDNTYMTLAMFSKSSKIYEDWSNVERLLCADISKKPIIQIVNGGLHESGAALLLHYVEDSETTIDSVPVDPLGCTGMCKPEL